MNSILKKIFGTLTEKPWEANQAAIDSKHSGQTFNISNQMSVVIIIFGISSVLFSLIFTGYLYSLPPGQDTTFILKTNMLWINTLVLIMVTYFFDKIRRDFNNNLTNNIKKNLIIVGALSYLFLILQLILWYQLMIDGNYVSTNTYFSSFYFFTALHGIHLLGGLFFWGKVTSKIFKLEERDYKKEERSITALSVYWLFLFIVWFVFFTIMFVYNDAVLDWCRSLIS
jgi:cytochrome c oxidase subunit 3|tara:strand:- start:368 stop:1048 length:681 start_codon:yes stop_codon:yes gene_type:complete